MVANETFGVGADSYVLNGLPATTYLFILTTLSLLNTSSVSKSVVDTTYPAAVSSVTLLSVASTSFIFEFEASYGADGSYPYLLFNQQSDFSFSYFFFLLFSAVSFLPSSHSHLVFPVPFCSLTQD